MQLLKTKREKHKNQGIKNNGHKGKSMKHKDQEKPRQIKDTKSHQLLDEESQTSIKRFGKDVGILTLSRNILKTHNLSFNQISNEVIPNLFMLSLRMLNRVLRYINSTRVITVNNHGILGYPIIN